MRVTLARLRELLQYDPETGEFRWRVKRKKVNPGDIAGTAVGKRYHMISIDNRTYLTHRLAWLYVHERWPTEQIDHINSNPFDNRICNLREASCAENTRHRPGDQNSKSGLKGVCFRARVGKWEANIMSNGVARYLGQFETSDEAQRAYEQAALQLHGAFAWRIQP